MQIVVTEPRYNSVFEEHLIWDVVDFVNTLFGVHYEPEEIPWEARGVYYVDFYQSCVFEEGGVWKFIAETQIDEKIVKVTLRAMGAINASAHRSHFLKLLKFLEGFDDKPPEYFEPQGFYEHPEVAPFLEWFDGEFKRINLAEDLVDLCHAFLMQLPHLVAVPAEQYPPMMRRICAAVPNRERRAEEARLRKLEHETAEQKKIRKLCEIAGQSLQTFNAVDMGTEDNVPPERWEWYVTTSHGVHYAMFAEDKVRLFDKATRSLVAERNSKEIEQLIA